MSATYAMHNAPVAAMDAAVSMSASAMNLSAMHIAHAAAPTHSDVALPRQPQPARPSIANLFSTWTLGVPYPLLFAAGAALGILFASLIVLCSSSRGAAASNQLTSLTAPIVAPVTAVSEPKWQPNVIVIRPAAPDPMFDGPTVIDPPSMAPPTPAAQARPAAHKRYVAPRRSPAHRPVGASEIMYSAI